MKKTVIALVFLTSSIFSQVDINIHLSSHFSILGGPRAENIITNNTPYFAEIVVMNEHVADIGPGASVSDRYVPRHEYLQLPVLARLFSNSEKTNFIGFAGRILSVSPGEVSEWIIKVWDI